MNDLAIDRWPEVNKRLSELIEATRVGEPRAELTLLGVATIKLVREASKSLILAGYRTTPKGVAEWFARWIVLDADDKLKADAVKAWDTLLADVFQYETTTAAAPQPETPDASDEVGGKADNDAGNLR